MALEVKPNEVGMESNPSLGVFVGPQAVVLMCISVMLGVALFRLLGSMGVGPILDIIISLLPMVGVTLFVVLMVNGKPPSYAMDFATEKLFRLRSSLYWLGVVEKPAPFWVFDRAPKLPGIGKKAD
jgi:hypothetical protein